MESVEEARKYVTDRLDEAVGTGTYSLCFILDLVMLRRHDSGNLFGILDEIAALEGNGRRSVTKPEKPFTGKHLRGYWHKHYTQAAFLPQNLLNETQLDNTVHRVLAPHIGQILTTELLGRLTHEVVVENFFRRSRESRFTGEWIVFAKMNRKNHYLTLARHNEDDVQVVKRIEHYRDIDRETGWTSGKGNEFYIKPTQTHTD